jgi:hypothetical protein
MGHDLISEARPLNSARLVDDACRLNNANLIGKDGGRDRD